MRKFLFSIRDLKNFIKPFCYISLAFVLAFGFITIVASGGGDGDENNQPPPIILGLWTWVSGDDTGSQAGVYGTKGVAAETTKPGSRNGSVSWIDSSDNLWLFGGWGYDANGNIFCYLNDLWKFDGTYWTWVSGDDTGDRAGVYGTKGVAAETNKPGSRSGSVSWIDSSGNLWLFGGFGYDANGNELCRLNDLWKFDGTYWTWVSGDDTGSQAGVYGTKGVAAETNKPGGRYGSVSWIDSSGNLWLFCGWGFGANGNIFCYLNDLWKFDGTYWTWVSGDDTGNRAGVYGTKGVAAETNKPGSRSGSVSWIDSSDNLWLFGGCYEPIFKTFNDLWKFDGTYWTWVSGDDTGNQAGVYGTKGVAAEINKPGSRFESVSWIDSSGNLWLFGGNVLNDLWKFTPNSNN